MRLHLMLMKRSIHFHLTVLAMAIAGVASGPVHAAPIPVYAYAAVQVSEGLSPPEADSQHGTGEVYAEAGDYCWFHAGTGGCGFPSASYGAVAAWGEVSANAALGTASLLVDAFNYGVPDPPAPLPSYTHWGVANGYTYLRSTWEVAATDPSLQIGDSVDIQISFDLDGVFDLGSVTDGDRGYGTAGVAYMLNHVPDAVWLEEDFYLDDYLYLRSGTFDDVQAGYGGLAIDSQRYSVSEVDGPVSLTDMRTISVQVGDVITLETAISTSVLIRNRNAVGDDDIIYIEGDFADTFSQSLQATTPGAKLTLVPEPSTAILVALGLGSLAAHRRRLQRR